MRFFLKISIPIETGNAAIADGSLGDTIKSILAEQKVEAAYFTAMDGWRTGLIFLDMKNPSDMVAVAEPWFLAFNAAVEFHPAMSLEDLAKAGPSMERAAKTYATAESCCH